MKKITSILLLVILSLMPIFVISCNDTANDNTENSQTITNENIEIPDEYTEQTEPIIATEKNTFDISDFKIIAPVRGAKLQELAISFKQDIKKATGVELSMLKSTSTSEKEILIGDCNRAVSDGFFAKDTAETYDKYGIIVKDSKIFIVGNVPSVISLSIEYFIENYLTNGTTFDIEKDAEIILDVPKDVIKMPEPKKEGELRIVSHNILQQGIKYDTARKDDLIFAMKVFDADIVSMQEVDNKWNLPCKIDDAMAEIGYSKVNVSAQTPIYYKTDSFKVVEFGRTNYEAVTAFGSNNWYVWAVFEEIATKKRFMIANTHLIWQAPSTVRDDSARQLVKDTKDVSAKYNGIPVISMGDFNSSTKSVVYSVMKEEYYSARDNCPVTVNMPYSTTNSCGESPMEGEAIDHVFYSKSGVVAKHFETVISPLVYVYSDHVPVCFDFELS